MTVEREFEGHSPLQPLWKPLSVSKKDLEGTLFFNGTDTNSVCGSNVSCHHLTQAGYGNFPVLRAIAFTIYQNQ